METFSHPNVLHVTVSCLKVRLRVYFLFESGTIVSFLILFQTFQKQRVPRGGDKETVCKTTLRIRFGPGCYQSLLRGQAVEVEGGTSCSPAHRKHTL